MDNAIGINVTEYAKLKASGKMTIVKIGDATVLLAHQKYNTETGQPDTPITSQLNMGNVEAMKASIAQQRAILDAATAGLDALEADMVALLA